MARRFSRRTVVGAAVVGLGTAVGYAAARVRNREPVAAVPVATSTALPATPSATATPSPPAQATATPQSIPAPDLATIQPAGAVFERVPFARDQEIDWSTGIFFMDVSSGGVDAIRLAPGVADEPALTRYTPMCGGAIVHAATQVKREDREFLLNRRTAQTWTWPSNAITARSLGSYLYLLAPGAAANESAPTTGILADSSLHELQRLTFNLASGYGLDERRGDLYTLTAASGQMLIHREPLPGGQPVLNYTVPAPKSDAYLLRTTADGNGLLVLDGRSGSAVTGWLLPFGRSLLPLPAGLTPGAPIAVSSDGNIAYETLIQPVTWNGEGPVLGWPAVVVASADAGQPLHRVRSAALYYPGQGFARRWTADGKALAMEVYAPRLSGEFAARGYAVLDMTASPPRISSLPTAPPTLRFPAGSHAPAIPSPWDSALFSIGKTAVTNLFSGANHAARMPSTFSATDLDPWSAGPFEVVFSGPQPGRGARGPWPYLPPVVENPPFDDAMRFLTAGAASDRRLFASAAAEAAVSRTLAAGEQVELAADASRAAYLDPSFDLRIEGGAAIMRVYVRTATGVTGWIGIEGLEWNVLAEAASNGASTPPQNA